ncbi:MAG: hypothetical protein HQK76_19365 [Desulfobacterales bacterium]|nr:hypothetical protein [Desulfobacterales bacterium]
MSKKKLLSLLSVIIYCFGVLPVSYAQDLKNSLSAIVDNMEKHIGGVESQKLYSIVVQSFIDETIQKPSSLTKEIEETLIDLLTERFRYKKNIMILERDRIEALEKVIFQEAQMEGTHFTQDAWKAKLGEKVGAGFLVTGYLTENDDEVRIRVKLIDIVKGNILESSICQFSKASNKDKVNNSSIEMPIYKKWWFWGAIIVVTAGIAIALGSDRGDDKSTTDVPVVHFGINF